MAKDAMVESVVPDEPQQEAIPKEGELNGKNDPGNDSSNNGGTSSEIDGGSRASGIRPSSPKPVPAKNPPPREGSKSRGNNGVAQGKRSENSGDPTPASGSGNSQRIAKRRKPAPKPQSAPNPIPESKPVRGYEFYSRYVGR